MQPEDDAQPRDVDGDAGGAESARGPGVDATAVPAAVRYKEIAATAASAADRMRKLEGDRIAELSGEVAAGRERIEEAERQRTEVEESVRERWDATREALWDERWMRVPPMPEPDTSAPAATPEESLRAVRAAYRDLYDALGKRRWTDAFKIRRGRQDEQ